MSSRRPITALAVVLTLLAMSLSVAVGPALAREGPDDIISDEVPVAILQEGENEPINTPYYVKTTSGAAVMAGSLSPAAMKHTRTASKA